MRVFCVLLGLLLLIGCRTSNKTGPTTIPQKSITFLKKKLEANHFEYQSLRADLRLNGELDGNRMRFSGHLRHIRDSVIWMNFTKFGFEIARVMVTRDSVFGINRLNREYIQEPLQYLEEVYDLVPSFEVIQEILIGVPGFRPGSQVHSKLDELTYLLQGDSNGEGIDLSVWLDGFKYHIIGALYKDQTGRMVTVAYLDNKGEQHKNLQIPSRRFETENLKEGKFALESVFQNVEKDKDDPIKFKIPRRYMRVR